MLFYMLFHMLFGVVKNHCGEETWRGSGINFDLN